MNFLWTSYAALTGARVGCLIEGRSLTASHGNPLAMIGIALWVFPKLALGLSGFETGVAVMPLVKGEAGDTEEQPAGRIRNTRRLLTTAALIMSVLLVGSSFVTAALIPAAEFAPGGRRTAAPSPTSRTSTSGSGSARPTT